MMNTVKTWLERWRTRRTILEIFKSWLAGSMIFEIVISLILTGIGLIIFGETSIGLIPLCIAGIMVAYGIRETPANPPSRGIVVILGERQPEPIKKEGFHLTLPPLMTIVNENVTRIPPKDMVFTGIPTNDKGRGKLTDVPTTRNGKNIFAWGSPVTAIVSTLLEPSDLYELQNTGGKDNAQEALKGMINTWLRYLGQINTWQGLVSKKTEVTLYLIKRLTNKEPNPGESYETFVGRMSKEGFDDIHKLGLKIRRLNVENISPEGEVLRNANQIAAEKQQRLSEMEDAKAYAEQIALLKNQGMSPEAAAKAVNLRRGLAVKEEIHTVDIRGDEGSTAAGLAALTALGLLGKNKPSQQRKNKGGKP